MKTQRSPSRRCVPILLLGLSAVAALGQGRIWWDENVHGPLSNVTNAPTALSSLVPGTNSIFGTISRVGGIIHSDYFTFNVPSSPALQAMWLVGDAPMQVYYDGDAGYVYGSYFGISSSGGVEGSTVMRTGQQWMAVLFNGGTSSTVNYRLDFVVAVPEPSTWLLGFTGLGVLLFLRHRRR